MKNDSLFALLAAAAIVGGLLAILHEMQPIFLAAITYSGIAIIIIVCAASLAILLTIIFLFTEKHPGRSGSSGSLLIAEYLKHKQLNKVKQLPEPTKKPDYIYLSEYERGYLS